jgi:hypothetical protein
MQQFYTNRFGPIFFLAATFILGVMAILPGRENAAASGQNNTIYLPLLVKPGTAQPGPTPTPSPTPSPTPPPDNTGEGALFLDKTRQTNSAYIQVDSSGGMHVAYAAFGLDSSGQSAAYYRTCQPAATDCSQVANWPGIAISDDVQEVQLQLTAAGQPRMLLKTGSGKGFFQYAACDANCTNPAQWDLLDVAYHEVVDMSLWDYGQNYFALDGQGRPRFIYFDNQGSQHWGSYYVFCDDNCTNIDNWYETRLDQGGDANYELFSYPSLAFTTAGQPRVISQIYTSSGPSALYYLQCNGNCQDAANWERVALFDRGSGHAFWVLRLNSSGQPRLAFYQGAFDDGRGEKLYYIWCNGNCLDGDSWDGIDLDLAPGMGQHPDLLIDGNNRPHLAFQINATTGLAYSHCTANCESDSGVWHAQVAEAAGVLDKDFPIAPPIGCDASYWYGGYRPSLALDGAGNPRIAYDAEHLYGDGVCATDRDYKAVRLIFFNQ